MDGYLFLGSDRPRRCVLQMGGRGRTSVSTLLALLSMPWRPAGLVSPVTSRHCTLLSFCLTPLGASVACNWDCPLALELGFTTIAGSLVATIAQNSPFFTSAQSAGAQMQCPLMRVLEGGHGSFGCFWAPRVGSLDENSC